MKWGHDFSLASCGLKVIVVLETVVVNQMDLMSIKSTDSFDLLEQCKNEKFSINYSCFVFIAHLCTSFLLSVWLEHTYTYHKKVVNDLVVFPTVLRKHSNQWQWTVELIGDDLARKMFSTVQKDICYYFLLATRK